LLLGLIYVFTTIDDTLVYGNYWGRKTSYWFVIGLVIPILHQFYVLIVWRSELFYKSISKIFGTKGFKIYKVGFAILFLSRAVVIILLAYSNAETLSINPSLTYILVGLLLALSLFLFYSVLKYFGMDRAVGLDHFDPETARSQTFVKRGIFKYSSNAMYVFGFMILWIPGLLLGSKAALLLAFFNHCYIWVHYYFTELPDIRVIYEGYKQ